jgi:hypothetical protein
VKATFRYLGLVSKTPFRLAHFYRTCFGLRELGRSTEGDVSLTDGFYNMTFLLQRPDRPQAGFRFAGVAADDVDELRGRLEEHAPDIELLPDTGGIHAGEFVLKDPNGLPVAVSTSNFGVPDGASQLPALVHAAMCAPGGQTLADFYANVFGLEDSGHSSRFGCFLSDGTTNLAILASAEEAAALGRRPNLDRLSSGWSHFGFEAPSAEEVIAKLPPDIGYTQRTDRPKSDGYYRIWDPDGNQFDLRSSPGWRGGDD